MTFLLLELIFADQLADLPPVVASSGQEWQYEISTVVLILVDQLASTVGAHFGRSTDRSTLQ